MTTTTGTLDLYALKAARRLAEKVQPFMDRSVFEGLVHSALMDAMTSAMNCDAAVAEKAEIYDYMKQVVDVAGFKSITEALVSAKKWRAIESAEAQRQLPDFPAAMWTCNGVGLFTEHQMQGYANAALALAEAKKS
jgi:hypothetical protein